MNNDRENQQDQAQGQNEQTSQGGQNFAGEQPQQSEQDPMFQGGDRGSDQLTTNQGGTGAQDTGAQGGQGGGAGYGDQGPAGQGRDPTGGTSVVGEDEAASGETADLSEVALESDLEDDEDQSR